MVPGNRQPKWDIYEAVILLDGYLEVLQANLPKAQIVKRISADLRRMAVNRGIKIDDIYRNENGISYQIQSMDSAYRGEKVYVPATKLFVEVVELYRTDTERYFDILKEAKNMVAAKKNNKEAFLAWAASVLPTQRCKWIEKNIQRVEQFAIATKMISGSIFDIEDTATLAAIYKFVGKNRIFQIKNRKLIKNINDDFKAYMQYCSQLTGLSEQVAETELAIAETPAGSIDTAALTESENRSLVVDFDSEESMAFTKPRSIILLGKELSTPSTWKDVYTGVVSALYERYPEVFSSLNSFPGSTRLEFGKADDAGCMTSPRGISEDLFIETNFSATDFIRRIKKLLSMCGMAHDSLIITYERRIGTSASNSTSSFSIPVETTGEAKFYAYLQNTAKLADRTCSSYVSSIRSAERYAIENGHSSCSLFSKDKETTVATTKELYGDPDFIRYNEQQHNRFSAAINKLLESIGMEIPKKAIASLDSSSDKQTFASSEICGRIVSVLKKHYEYGFKYDSIRELMRFRQFAEAMEISLPEDDELLKAAILSSGTVIDNKVYCKNDDMSQELRRIVDNAFSSGAGVIYYESLFENEQGWMNSYAITSPDMLKEYLQKNIAGCSFAKKFMIKGSRLTEKKAVTDEIKRVWGNNQSVSVYSLHDRLPYIPLNNIWRVISGNDLFVLVSEGEYLFIDRFRISEDEEEEILDFVNNACEENGFASLSDVPLGSIEEENYKLSQLAIYNAIYKKVLSGKYHLNGKILTKEKSELDAVALLKKYIKDRDECTFDEVADKVVELTGSTNRQYAFQALYDDMVRVDRNRFVANRLVNFSVDEIDAVLSGFITDKFIAIRDVTTFAMFPICGQNWNHYLLESYCYKYSKKYSLHVIHFNDKNAGIIAEKDFNKKYNEMLAMALARTNVELSPDVIGQYLFNTGYMAKSKYAKLGEIAQRASELRKER